MADSKSVKSAEGLKTGERVSDGEEGGEPGRLQSIESQKVRHH